MNKYICVHGHFYQPPRENPWLEDVELQESAHPYHDWNERVTAESYEPNAAARVVDAESRIIDIVNNYSRISFNFGPTLLSWMKKHQQEVYNAIIQADKDSRERFGGHGSAIAQGYSHMIMPLANSRDKRTQIIWGIKDFRSRFGRDPEGMWLPETAVDSETLRIMAEEGIKFTILAPRQAKRVRKMSATEESEVWHDVAEGTVDPRRPYICRLEDGKEINIFFYDGNIAHDVAFGKMLTSGEEFANRMLGTLDADQAPQIANVATDGETFGHHQAYGDMTLGYCISFIESHKDFELTNYGEFLSRHNPEYEVEIHENSSWSCVHGIERWRDDCGCSTGMNPNWHQKWRKPLREALDHLREDLIGLYEKKAGEFFKAPWEARDEYIEIILDRAKKRVDSFLKSHALRPLSDEEVTEALKLLEMQRYSMLMYTSCGWFFDELSGIETMQVIQYAARALQLANEIEHSEREKTFISMLENAPSNLPEKKNGGKLFLEHVQNCVLDLLRVGAHFAVSSFFEKYPPKTDIYCYSAETDLLEQQEAGKHKIVFGRVDIRSSITLESVRIVFTVMHLGDHNIVAGVTRYTSKEDFSKTIKRINRAFAKTDIANTIQLIRKYFGEYNYTLWHLFKDEQKKILDRILKDPVLDIEQDLKKFQKQYYPLIKAVHQMNVPLPGSIKGLLDLTFNIELNNLLLKKKMKVKDLDKLIDEATLWGVDLDKENIAFLINLKINSLMENLKNEPENVEHIKKIEHMLSKVAVLELELKLWKTKNIYFFMSKDVLPDKEKAAKSGDNTSAEWVEAFKALSPLLHIKV